MRQQDMKRSTRVKLEKHEMMMKDDISKREREEGKRKRKKDEGQKEEKKTVNNDGTGL
jgi:hypothetical protein